MAQDLALLGYTATSPNATCPAASRGSLFRQEDFLSGLQASSAAFAPYRNSTARKVGIRNKTDKLAANEELHPRLVDLLAGWDSKEEDPEAFSARLGSSAQGLDGLGQVLDAIASTEDDGVAVFWKEARLRCTGIAYLASSQGDIASSVQVTFQDKARSNLEFAVMTSHLASGTGMKQERRRIEQMTGGAMVTAGPREQVPVAGLREWFEQSAALIPTVFAMDANTSPYGEGEPGEESVWRVAMESRISGGVGSVWEGLVDVESPPVSKGGTGAEVPVTVNKMRGPESGQPSKIGHHAFDLIDHVFYTKGDVESATHAISPTVYASAEEGQTGLIPNLDMPSDHYPVVVDIRFRGSARADLRLDEVAAAAFYRSSIARTVSNGSSDLAATASYGSTVSMAATDSSSDLSLDEVTAAASYRSSIARTVSNGSADARP